MFSMFSCVKEYLELRDGSTENSPFIGRYCSKTPNFVTTEGNALYVKYFTDTDDPKDGFRATISIGKYFVCLLISNFNLLFVHGFYLNYNLQFFKFYFQNYSSNQVLCYSIVRTYLILSPSSIKS